MNRKTRFTIPRLLLAVLLVALFSSGSWVAYQVGSYFGYLDAFSGDIARGEESTSRDGLKDLQYFYDLSRRADDFYLGWIADLFGRDRLFKDFNSHRAAYYYVSGDREKAIEQVRDAEGFWPAYIRGIARWRQDQAKTANGLNLKDPKEMAKQLKDADDEAGTTVKDDFEAALKADPSHVESSWDYDMTSDPKARAAGLAPKPAPIKTRLGVGGGGPRQPGPEGDEDKEGLGKKSKDLDSKDPGPGRPDGKPGRVG